MARSLRLEKTGEIVIGREITLIDYGSGNYASVRNAFIRLGAEVVRATRPEHLRAGGGVVLPGVGSFAGCMKRLTELDLVDSIREVARTGRPFLGICVGLQVLATKGEEFGEHQGLGLIPGTARMIDTRGNERLPHVGWNDCEIVRSSLLMVDRGVPPCFYFVHSYHLVPDVPEVIVATCEYGESVTAIAARDNVMGVQFHPEKSQRDGLAVLQAFLDLAC